MNRLLLASLIFILSPATVAITEEAILEVGQEPQLIRRYGAGEGPAWHPDQGLFSSGEGNINVLARDGTSRVFRPNAGSNGLLFDHQGHLLVCEPVKRQVSRINVPSGRHEVLTDSYDGKRFNQPNDITVDSRGRIYFSDPRYGSRHVLKMLDNNGRQIEGV